jgi:hypothetical protein
MGRWVGEFGQARVESIFATGESRQGFESALGNTLRDEIPLFRHGLGPYGLGFRVLLVL